MAKKIDIEALKMLLKNVCIEKTSIEEINKITVDEEGWVYIDGYSYALLEEVEE